MALQAASPEVTSLPTQAIESGARYQPAPFAARLGVATVVGATVS